MTSIQYRCRICAAPRLILVKPMTAGLTLSSAAFRITDANYGSTAAIYRCEACGFLQCPEVSDLLGFYETMEDEGYEDSAPARALQARMLLRGLSRHLARPEPRLLDIGAGSGILVEEAKAMGICAEGLEPSAWLQTRAAAKGLTVHRGVLPHPDARPPYDVVTLVDIIEHVMDPVELLRNARDMMAEDGIGLVVTPDVNSLAARLLGWKWWHYRVAHVGYFNQKTLNLALSQAGLRPLAVSRPWWYFPADYLAARIQRYLPPILRMPVPQSLSRVTIPLNLFDSLAVVFAKK